MAAGLIVRLVTLAALACAVCIGLLLPLRAFAAPEGEGWEPAGSAFCASGTECLVEVAINGGHEVAFEWCPGSVACFFTSQYTLPEALEGVISAGFCSPEYEGDCNATVWARQGADPAAFDWNNQTQLMQAALMAIGVMVAMHGWSKGAGE